MFSVQSLLTKPDGWKSTRGIDDDDDDEAWFDEEEEEMLPGGGEPLATPCMIAARLSPDCDQISQYLDKGLSVFSLLFKISSVPLVTSGSRGRFCHKFVRLRKFVS